MFNRKKRREQLLEAVNMVRPTSKAALKQQCLYLSNLDIDKAEKMYNFLVKDMEDIPAVEPSSQGFLKNFGDQANGVMGWLRDNQDMLEQGVDFFRNIFNKRKGGTPLPPLPPINE